MRIDAQNFWMKQEVTEGGEVSRHGVDVGEGLGIHLLLARS